MPGRLTTSDLNHALRGATISGAVELVDKPIQAGAEVHVHLSQIGSAMQSAPTAPTWGPWMRFSVTERGPTSQAIYIGRGNCGRRARVGSDFRH